MRRKNVCVVLCLVFLILPFAASAGEGERVCDVFTDEAFRNAVCEKAGIRDDTSLISEWENVLGSFTELSAASLGIKNISGIEYFTSLEILDISGNDVTDIDVLNNKELIYLFADGNKIEKCDLSELVNLEFIYMQNCGIKEISLPEGIKKAYLSGNDLEEIYAEDIPAVTELSLKHSGLLRIDLSENLLLSRLWLDGNRLDEVIIPGKKIYDRLLLGSQEFTFGITSLGEYKYTPKHPIISATKPLKDGNMFFPKGELQGAVNMMMNVSSYPMNVHISITDMSGDTNKDNKTNSDDLSALLENYSQDMPLCDVNSDGSVNAEDISYFLSVYGNICDKQ
ncbi:MAG: hypothetical protein IKM61_08600 [Eubacteriaceae bacterium]|nr:hypothetical protein [Eubacteriaceae bacterium]